MAANVRNLNQWTVEDFANYFTGSKRLLGNSTEFENIKNMAQELMALDSQTISHDMVYERKQKLEQLSAAATGYLMSHTNPRTSTGKERKEVMQAFMQFCQNEKQYMDVEANEKFFHGKTVNEVRKGVTYKEIGEMHGELDRLRSLPMTEENAIKYTNAMNRVVQASEVFLAFQPEGTMYHPVKERESIQGVLNVYKPCLSAARDLRTVRRLIAEGKSWKDLDALRDAAIEVSGRQEKVGANVSQRLKIQHNGKTGFFTEETYLAEVSETIDAYIAQHNSSKEDRLIAANHYILKEVRNIPKEADTNNSRVAAVYKTWDRMPESGAKNDLYQIMTAPNGLNNLNGLWNNYQNDLKLQLSDVERSDAAKRKQTFLNVVNRYGALSEQERAFYTSNVELMSGLMERTPEKDEKGIAPAITSLEVTLYEDMLRQDQTTKEGREAYRARRELLDNPKALADAANLLKRAEGLSIGKYNARIDERDSAEATKRNVATSRMAELLGVGNLVAHSEKMTVTIDGKQVNGCFMEFAEGVDLLATNDINQLRAASETTLDYKGNLAKDSANLGLFDIICAQADRHAGNFFTILGERDAEGKRAVIGLQGIDNDLAFSRRTDMDKKSRSGNLEDKIFVDAEFARKVNALTREKVEYAVGDLLNSAEIDGIMGRVDRVKEHIRDHAIVLEGDQWKLDAYSIDADTKNLDDYGKKYVDGLKALKTSAESKYVWDQEKHESGKAIHNLKSATAHYGEVIKEEEELYGSISEMFEQAEADAEKAKRAAIFDKIAADKDKAPAEKAAVSEEKKTEKETVKMSLDEFAGPKKVSERGIKIGAAREAAAKKQEKSVDLGFTEITAEDIKEANKNVKKPIIGAHRKK